MTPSSEPPDETGAAEDAGATAPPPRDAAYWAKRVSKLTVSQVPEGASHRNVEGRRLVGPMQGFGKMWQKTYRVRLRDTNLTPAEVIATWKERFATFWPAGNQFYEPLTGIAPGEVALLRISLPGKTRLSTGVMVLYADDESFTLRTPEGHMLAGWITFSALRDGGVTVAQAQVLMRANDPVFEMGLMLGGHRKEDRFWEHTLRALATHLGGGGEVRAERVLVDRRRQWSNARNIRYNAMIRGALRGLGSPVRLAGRPFQRRGSSGGGSS